MERGSDELVASLARDLNSAFEKLVLTYQHQLYAFVLARIGETSMAEEIVQSAFIRAYYALRQYSVERIRVLRLSAWLYEITRNTLYNYQREHQSRLAHLVPGAFDLSEESPLLLVEDRGSTPDEEVFRSEERRELAEQIQRLPVHFQTAIQLYYFDNLSYNEIAEQLAMPVGTVKSHVYRGMQLLRTQMKEA